MGSFYAGFGREEYTPDKVVPLNSVRKSDKVVAPLKVTCVALSDGENKVLIFSNDLRNSTAVYVADVKKRVSAETGIPEGNVFVTATHNHSAPDINYYDDDAIVDWRERIAFPAILKSAKDALADLSFCSLSEGKTQVHKVAYTRRYFREDGTFHGIHVPKSTDSPIARHETEADPELRLLRFEREGKRDLVLVNFQVHAATAASAKEPFLCADFIHPLREKVEGAEEVLIAYLQGGCGNSNTYSKLDPDAPNDNYILAGERIADGVLEALKKTAKREAGKICVQNGAYEATVNHAKSPMASLALEIFQKIEKLGIKTEKEKRELFQANGFASRYEAAAIRRRAKLGKTDSLPLSTLCFGDVSMTFAPVEMFDEPFRMIRNASPFKTTLTVGYANGNKGYVPSAYGFSNGGYETLQCSYIPGTGESCALELLRQLEMTKKEI